jgi:endonuclease/exonuclease/phosphatase (EEP) superfamily protein YafD
MKLRWLLVGLLTAVVLVPALLISTARALDLPGGLWVRLVAFTPYAALLFLVAAVLLLLVWLSGHGGVPVRVLTVLCLVGVGIVVYWASGPYVGSSPADAAGHTKIRVMTSNLRFGGGDTAQVVQLAVSQDVDVLVLEEVTPSALAGLTQAGLTKVFPHHAGAPVAGSRGTMVFTRGPVRHVTPVPTRFASYSMDVALGGGRGTLHLLAVHPHPPTGDISRWHADQLEVRRAAEGLPRPTVIAGDFNATMDHVSMRDLAGRGYDDAATEARSGWQPTWPSAGMVSRMGIDVPSLVAIDHVMARGLRATHTSTYRIDGTDHRALVATLAR